MYAYICIFREKKRNEILLYAAGLAAEFPNASRIIAPPDVLSPAAE